MACSLCHVSFDPVRPPADVNNPKWENLNDYVGAQYFNVGEFFVSRRVKDGKFAGPEEESFIYQLIHSSPSGSLDTSFIATDYLNNPGTMNGVFTLKPGRLDRAAKGVKSNPGQYDPKVEWLTGGALDLMWLEGLDNGTQLIPRVLKQGDDSVGFEGALSRVYVNIGHAWPQWKQHFRPLVGGPFPHLTDPSQSPVTVREMQVNSPSWNWSEARSRALALYFIQYAKPLLLKDAPGGAALIDQSKLDRGKQVFAENCAACHSSKQPDKDPFGPDGKITDEAKNWFRTEVAKPDFFTDNFLSDERRHPVTQIGTNSTRAAATNATRSHIWDNFSSETYKTLPAIGTFEVDNPPDLGGRTKISIPLPGELPGPGYYRPPSLISLWSSAPYLHNNTVGIDPTAPPLRGKVDVPARMQAFQDGIEKMLWIKPRGTLIWKTSKKSYINVPVAYLPDFLQDVKRNHSELYDAATDSLRLGPIPAGTPINLIANTNLDAGIVNGLKRADLVLAIIDVLARIKRENLNDAQVAQLMKQELVPKFLAINKCPDFYEDKGHEFGKDLPEPDKRALIELLKTF
jgi:hypothetical protein